MEVHLVCIGLGLLCNTLVLACIAFAIHALIKEIKQLPNQIAEKMIEKLREEENRKLFERNSDQKANNAFQTEENHGDDGIDGPRDYAK